MNNNGRLNRDDVECIALRDAEIIELFRQTEALIAQHKESLAEFDVLADKAVFKINEVKNSIARFEMDRVFAIGLLEFELNKVIVERLTSLIERRRRDGRLTTLAELEALLT